MHQHWRLTFTLDIRLVTCTCSVCWQQGSVGAAHLPRRNSVRCPRLVQLSFSRCRWTHLHCTSKVVHASASHLQPGHALCLLRRACTADKAWSRGRTAANLLSRCMPGLHAWYRNQHDLRYVQLETLSAHCVCTLFWRPPATMTCNPVQFETFDAHTTRQIIVSPLCRCALRQQHRPHHGTLHALSPSSSAPTPFTETGRQASA